ncbi:hypothetical protein D3C87_2060500 [compost metagenome]
MRWPASYACNKSETGFVLETATRVTCSGKVALIVFKFDAIDILFIFLKAEYVSFHFFLMECKNLSFYFPFLI